MKVHVFRTVVAYANYNFHKLNCIFRYNEQNQYIDHRAKLIVLQSICHNKYKDGGEEESYEDISVKN